MEKAAINELNALLKGEQMAIDAYERYIQDVDDENVKHELQQIQQDHRKHAGELAARIQTLGGDPDYSTGFVGFMASAKAVMEGMNGHKTVDILKKAYDGEDKGIAKAEEVVKGDLDGESAALVNKLLSDDHDHLKKMVNLIADFENRH